MTVYESIDPAVTSTFVGYDTPEHGSRRLPVLTTETEAGGGSERGTEEEPSIVEETPFYAAPCGGQAGRCQGVTPHGGRRVPGRGCNKTPGRQDRSCRHCDQGDA